jgi:hypothetical protein
MGDLSQRRAKLQAKLDETEAKWMEVSEALEAA